MLKALMDQVETFVYDVLQQKHLVLTIESYSLRKALDRQVKKVYLNMGVFVDCKRTSTEVKVQKSRTFKQANFLKGFAKKNSQEDS